MWSPIVTNFPVNFPDIWEMSFECRNGRLQHGPICRGDTCFGGRRTWIRATRIVRSRKTGAEQWRIAESVVLRHIRLELSRLGNNLNQMVRRLNEYRKPLPVDLEPLLADIRALIGRTRNRRFGRSTRSDFTKRKVRPNPTNVGVFSNS
ncbi:MAG: plasmid mobilization relaxosome protein MobC [Xanthobacteraceae bacterium]